MNEQLPSEKYFDLRCAHGRRAYERCRDCEESIRAGTGTGFDRPPPGDLSRETLQMIEDAEREDYFGD